MKHSASLKWIGLGSLLTSLVLNLHAQPNPFHSKKHKDTVLTKSGLHNFYVNGLNAASFTNPQSISCFNKPISASLSTKTSNLRQDNSIEVITSLETGLPVFIKARLNSSNQRIAPSTDKTVACFEFLELIKDHTKIVDPSKSFEIKDENHELNGKSHFKLNQKYKGIQVYGSEVIVHLNSLGQGETFNGNYQILKNNIDIMPKISPSSALIKVLNDISAKTTYRKLSTDESKLLKYKGPLLDTVIYVENSAVNINHLAYHISIYPNLLEHWEYFVDAKTGYIINSFKNSCHVNGSRNALASDLNGKSVTINTYQVGNTYYLLDGSKPMFNLAASTLPDQPIGAISTLDLKGTYGNNTAFSQITSTSNSWSNPIAVSAHDHANQAYEYYKNVHSRNSIDARGGTIVSLINVVDNDGSALDNAYWNGEAIFYGNGSTYFKPLAGSMDVSGHELTHGVVQTTANLRYNGESGAINESMADIFGCMMDSTDWLMGEDIVKVSAYPSGALRSFSDPHNGGNSLNDDGYQPKHMNEKYKGAMDNGGVHINSGIPNFAFYKLATSISSKLHASKIFYRALSVYLTASSQFSDLRLAVIQSATDIYGPNSNEVTQSGLAFDAVGILDAPKVIHTQTLPTNPGTEYLLSYNSDSTKTDGIYRSSTSGSGLFNLVGKKVFNKPSVTDDGEICVFIGSDHRIYQMNVNPLLPLSPKVLNDFPIWGNAAISKDGKRLAAVTLDQDTSIYVYEIDKAKLTKFKLYNPTYTEGVKAVGPVYADAIEWSYNGESILYDCYNVINNSSGKSIEYWDINLIKVWDNAKNDVSTGEVFKLFNNLDEGENIGNPVFSRNSPNIIAFDYINDITQEAAVLGLDLELNDLNLIASNNTLGYPCFNKTDTRVAFATYNTNFWTDINYVTLNSDKISSDDNQRKLISTTTSPVYFSVGTRNLVSGLEESKSITTKISAYPNPVSNILNINVPEGYIGMNMDLINVYGETLASLKMSSSNVSSDMNHLPEGIYTLIFRGNNTTEYFKIIKK